MHNQTNDTVRPKLGMWLFLFTELLLFGGLFILYAAYLRRYPQEFHRASQELSLLFGGMNTVILLTSSLCVALAVIALEHSRKKASLIYLIVTVALAAFFLVNKYFEWRTKFGHGIYPNSPELLARGHGENIFFALYFFLTGLHGVHVIIGMTVLTTVMVLVQQDKVQAGNPAVLFNAGLYWHLVDVIWIYLFPLLYLIS
jgi:cytochrome c oxidase subunit III